LHFFHSSDKKEAFVLNITNLDEVLTVLLHNIPKEQQPSYNILIESYSSYLVTLPATLSPGKKTPPIQILTALENKGIPILSELKLI
jgi:hypothetical protein